MKLHPLKYITLPQFTLVLNSKKEHIKSLSEQLSAAEAKVESLMKQLVTSQGDEEDVALATTEDEEGEEAEEQEEDEGRPFNNPSVSDLEDDVSDGKVQKRPGVTSATMGGRASTITADLGKKTVSDPQHEQVSQYCLVSTYLYHSPPQSSPLVPVPYIIL